MKKKILFLSVAFMIILSLGATAQPKTGGDYFAGKWDVLVKGTPNGDAQMIFILEKKDATMTGVVQDTTGAEISKISSADLKENSLTVYFNAQGYDVYLMIDKKDDTHVTGNLMGMFDAEGKRMEEGK